MTGIRNGSSDITTGSTDVKRIIRDTCTPLLITALLTIAKRWKQPKCPSTD